jgi:hypothetical protein
MAALERSAGRGELGTWTESRGLLVCFAGSRVVRGVDSKGTVRCSHPGAHSAGHQRGKAHVFPGFRVCARVLACACVCRAGREPGAWHVLAERSPPSLGPMTSG